MYAYGFVIDEIIILKSCNDIPISSYFFFELSFKKQFMFSWIGRVWARIFSLWHLRIVQSLSLKELQLCHIINLFHAFKENSQNWETFAQGQRPSAKVSQDFLSVERQKLTVSQEDIEWVSHYLTCHSCQMIITVYYRDYVNAWMLCTLSYIYICHDQVNVAKMLQKAANIIHLIHGFKGYNQTVVLRYEEKRRFVNN